MTTKNSFIIPFKSLCIGRHEFSWVADTSFFEMFPNSEIQDGLLNVAVTMNKNTQFLVLNFHLDGRVQVPCDRCLDLVEVETTYQAELFVKFGESTQEETEELIILAYEEHELNVAQYVYEYAHLSLPYRIVHGEDKEGRSLCNPEMMMKLQEYLIEAVPEDEEDEEDEFELVNN